MTHHNSGFNEINMPTRVISLSFQNIKNRRIWRYREGDLTVLMEVCPENEFTWISSKINNLFKLQP
jgi:hypothetical protein